MNLAVHARPTLRIAPLYGSGNGLLYRMALFNLAGAALLGAAWGEGWVQMVFAGDSTGITYVIAAVFLIGLAIAFRMAHKVVSELECARKGAVCEGTWTYDYLLRVEGRKAGSRAIAGQTLRAQVAGRIAPVRQIAGSLVILGLIGTVLGFIMALSGISASMATDVSQVTGMITRLIAGMSVALYTTLEGAILSLWLTINHQMLASGAAQLVSGLVMLGENHARD